MGGPDDDPEELMAHAEEAARLSGAGLSVPPRHRALEEVPEELDAPLEPEASAGSVDVGDAAESPPGATDAEDAEDDEPALDPGAPSFPGAALTRDTLLGGRVKFQQPKIGYRAAVDPVLLAAACPATRGERVLDVGCGAGAASLCLAARVFGLDIEGLELQPAYAALARRNSFLNGHGMLVHQGDVRDAPLFARAKPYDHVITNPPFWRADEGAAGGRAARDLANRETASLQEWLDFCLRRLQPKGTLTLIHRAERLGDVLAVLAGRAGAVRVLPVRPRVGSDARRILVRAVKGSNAPMALAAGLALHGGAPGQDAAPYAEAVRAILEDGAALDF